ncbi:MAG TPA: hypothetical protein DDY14_02685 [Chromatiaceae bacterium]|jgi:hypothetical protein|nr:MAG: hypothetical protein N838_19855 [Thiohalocapsa sp. PB-PSB1]QQO53331.1 MAG: hypothetical protein N838_08085 [Thiohalocapsa sp. PB-PSB1]HBG94233.1 hypothetical protein [Chromatiaceae bacterium]HCS92409.1 hypothetical protein [Chromatiaceae bacterium]
MNHMMAVLLNGIAQIEFDRTKPIPDHQGAFLKEMDRKMDQGVDLGGKLVSNPDLGQRAQFVAANLAHAIKTNNEAKAAAMCTYLAVRMTDLKQVKIREEGEDFSIELDFEHAYVKQAPIRFAKPGEL